MDFPAPDGPTMATFSPARIRTETFFSVGASLAENPKLTSSSSTAPRSRPGSTVPDGSGGVVRIVNIFGFFIEGMGRLDPDTGAIIFDPNDPLRQNADTVIGRVMTLPGMFTGSSTVDESASFLRTIILVR